VPGRLHMKVVYALLDQDQEVRYVGCTGNLPERLRLHWSSRFRKELPVARWLRTLEAMPEHLELEAVPDEVWLTCEEIWIKAARNSSGMQLLNLTDRGGGQVRGVALPGETKQKIADSLRGYQHTAAATSKMSKAAKERALRRYKVKLIVDDVSEIRQSKLSYDELAVIYDVHISTIYRVRNRETWKHVD
jgi:predicted GIY-YIG superfamily endonuclease